MLNEGARALFELVITADKRAAANESEMIVSEYVGLYEDTGDEEDDDKSKDVEVEPPMDKRDDVEHLEEGKQMVISSWKKTTVPDGNSISLNHVVLRYPFREDPVLNNFSRSFERGKIHALTGESGAGKSTMVKVLAELIFPQVGELKVWDGMKVAYASQDQVLFSRSIRENVTYGTRQPVNDDEIWDALRRANIDHWVRTLPNQLDDVLQNGEDACSGGQAQKLILAHMFCTCGDRDLFILDECVSALDVISRDRMIDELGAFLKGKTAILITHNTEMLRICDYTHDFSSIMPTPVGQRGRRSTLLHHHGRRRASVLSSGRISAASSRNSRRSQEESSVVKSRRAPNRFQASTVSSMRAAVR